LEKTTERGSFVVCAALLSIILVKFMLGVWGLKRYVYVSWNLKDGDHLEDVVGADWIRLAEDSDN